jgi:hypothetical protein
VIGSLFFNARREAAKLREVNALLPQMKMQMDTDEIPDSIICG